jgi:4'-phosphopantetheinyl transferase EntD
MVVDALKSLFPDDVAIAHDDPRAARSGFLDEEERYVAHAIPRRKREFHAGRACAGNAMNALGLKRVPIPAANDRSPVWPDGVVGSISHCDTLCVAAVGLKADGYLSMGLDVEPAEALPADLFDAICTRQEQDWLEDRPSSERALLVRTIFSAKEATYKCQYPLTGMMMDFQDLEISLGTDSFGATFRKDIKDFTKGTVLPGSLAVQDGYIFAAMVMTTQSRWNSR